MLHYNNCAFEDKPDLRSDDDGADFDLAVLFVASRFNVAPHLAKVIAECAGLGVTVD